ncbi:growth-regulating factor 5 isoform X4 [Populus trichocarpa]|uniref:growth-regulating factor 5 isoform X4 n=1 Tax=Populus trichocarpa TaxID=3694 RepID=UPI0022782956|nr:growth-regulating factor 5 isoform X4 [Populus trichocarpa]
MSNSSVTVAGVGSRSPPGFTMSQWHELEHQVLIFKCLNAGLPVPPSLLLPILSYCSYFGKKIDSEPGRCRRTDGKKWRCSKDAHPDSKYCERHMNRSRNRSRKPVESQTTSQSLSTVASEIATGSSSIGSRGYPTNPGTLGLGSNMSRWQMESMPYGVNSKDYRSLHGPKPEADEKTFLPEALGNTRSFGMNSTVDSTWHLTSQVPANPVPESRNGSLLQNYPQVQTLQDFEPLTVDAASSKQQQQQHYLFGREFSSSGSMRRENQSLQPLFDEWPKCRDMDSHLTDQRSNNNSSAVQLSMAIPMAPNPAARSYHSPNGETDA